MKIFFRVDASLEIGTGHVRRCLTLADALCLRGCECSFVCREHPGNMKELVLQHGYEVHGLSVGSMDDDSKTKSNEEPAHAAWLGADWASDAEKTKAAIGKSIVDWLIVDHYGLDVLWETKLRPHCHKILLIDDLADRSHDCDLLLDQNLVANWQHRYQDKVPEDCGLMLGTEYALLQPKYAKLHDRVQPREGLIRRILVYFGGADIDNLTGLVINAFLSLKRKDIELDVVINPASSQAAVIRSQVEGIMQITLHEELPSLAPLMVKADFAIGAGGASSWERCCLGLPSMVITIANNQKPIAAELERQGLIRWYGHKDDVSQSDLAQALNEVIDGGLEASWSEKCWQLVDGRGVWRVCDKMVNSTSINASYTKRS